MERISVDELDPDCFHSEFWERGGKPFTGVVVDAEHGLVVGEWFCRGGWRWGPQREWCANGGLWKASYCVAGTLHGVYRWWNSDGSKYVIKEYRLGALIRRRRWDSDGSVDTELTRELYPRTPFDEVREKEILRDIIKKGGNPNEVPVPYLELLPGEWDDRPAPGDAARWAAWAALHQ